MKEGVPNQQAVLKWHTSVSIERSLSRARTLAC